MFFISTQKPFSFSRYLDFCLGNFGRVAKRLDQNDKVNFKIYDVTTWLTKSYNHILPNISGRKLNQTMKLGQLINNMRNIFLEKSYARCGGETSPRPFSERFKLSISMEQWSKVLYSLFLLYAKLWAIGIY